MITFDKTEFLLPDIKYGDTKSVSSLVTNTGDIDVDLIPYNSSCSCTTGTVNQRTLKPGESTHFIILLNSGKAGKGDNQVKTIELKYNINRLQYSQIFRLKVNVI